MDINKRALDLANHLLDIETGLKKHDIECGYYVGGMKPQGLRDAQEKNVIFPFQYRAQQVQCSGKQQVQCSGKSF